MNFIEHLKLLAHLSLPPKLLVTLKWVGSVALGTAVDTWGVSHTPPPSHCSMFLGKNAQDWLLTLTQPLL